MQVPFGMHFLGGLAERHADLVFRLAGRETRAVSGEPGFPESIASPIHVCGLARSGSTILLELLSEHPETASHVYRDYPFAALPVWWNRFLDRAVRGAPQAVQRAHQDRILVTPMSPEAMEEIIWMHFFPQCHDPRESAILAGETANPAFERFYRDHVRKVLFVRGGSRYLAKGNYNVTRMAYILKLFPDARFVVPVRDPVGHVASLMKQHALFVREERRDPRIGAYMRRSGHFEFGLGRRAVNAGDDELARSIEGLWAGGEEVRGWARTWAAVYSHVAAALKANEALRRAAIVIHYETLCAEPGEVLSALYEHCSLPMDWPALEAQAGRLSPPAYYTIAFTDEEKAVIREETAEAAAALGLQPIE